MAVNTVPLQEFKWSTGEKYEQSLKTDKEKYMENDNKPDYNNMKTLDIVGLMNQNP